MSAKLDAALDAARRGFSVFPIVENSKVARIKSWPNLATQDEQQIRQWWTDYPNDNIGATTNNLVVVDVDPRNGGAETMSALLDFGDWPKTLCSRTQSGGDHIIYAAPDGPVKGGTHKLGKGIDVKARGGYILLPGSEIDGRTYKWTNERPIAAAPQWIVDQCKKAKPKDAAAGKRIVEEDETAFQLAERWMLTKAPHAEHGEIDDTTYKVAARLYDFGLTEHSVLEIMEEWNETHCSPPGNSDRLPVVVESAGKNRENSIGSKHPLAPGFTPIEIDESKAPKPSTQDAADPARHLPEVTLTAESFEAAAEKALQDNAEPLIKEILDRAAMSVLYGESNTGKTFVAIDKCYHIATGRPWAGRRTRKGAVVYVAAEGGRGIYKRLAALRKHYPDDKPEDVLFFVVKFPVDLLHGPEHGRELARVCEEVAAGCGYPIEIIVIDTLSRVLSGGDENSSTDMGGIVKSFDALREVTGAHLMVIHHSGKDRARGARGHSLLRAATDTEIEIERGKIAVTKQRDLDGDFKQWFKLKPVNIGTDRDGQQVASCVVELTKTGAGGEVAVPPTSAELELCERIADIVERAGERYFNAETVRKAYMELQCSNGTSDNAIYTRLGVLQSKGLVKKHSPGQYVIECDFNHSNHSNEN